MILWCAGVYQHPSTFRSLTLQPVGVDQATIWQIKENFLSFDMMHVRFISPKRLHGKIKWRPLPFFPLVYPLSFFLVRRWGSNSKPQGGWGSKPQGGWGWRPTRCTSDDDCTRGSYNKCITTNGRCVQCIEDSDCDGRLSRCAVYNKCVDVECIGDSGTQFNRHLGIRDNI